MRIAGAGGVQQGAGTTVYFEAGFSGAVPRDTRAC